MMAYKVSKSNYIVASACLILLNILSGSILLFSTFAQISDNLTKDQTPIVPEIVKQKNCPLTITIINVDNSASSFQKVDFVLRNVSNKSVRAYVLLGQANTTGKINTYSFATKFLRANEFHEGEVFLERVAIRESKQLFLSIDYAEFEDGSSWGADSQGFSKNISGERAGRLAAIRELKNVITSDNLAYLTGLLNQDITEMAIDLPKSKQSEGWKKGYKTGYKTVFSMLQSSEEKDIEKFKVQLDEMEKFAK
jgi:hypothetical protein